MPLICEIVAARALQRGLSLIFYFDPDATNKNKRRQQACCCFAHDDCVPIGTSRGERNGIAACAVASIASSPIGSTSINPVASQVLLASMSIGNTMLMSDSYNTNWERLGLNPPPNQPRIPTNSSTGQLLSRWYWVLACRISSSNLHRRRRHC